jgi:outer membrane protein OmpA-like peptidoglycan-associated protein
MNGEYILLGDFRGNFFTLQSTALGSVDLFPDDLSNAVRVYSGDLKNAQFEEDYQPEKYRKHGSFLLVNVPKIEVSPIGKGPFQDSRTYNFTQLVLIEPRVLKTYELNGKTYGEIESKAYGITEKYPMVKPLDPDHPNNVPPPLVGEDFNGEDDVPSNPLGNEDLIGKTRKGCGTLLSGCLANFWRIFLLILLIFLITILFKTCQSDDENQCLLRDQTKAELELEKIRRDSVMKEYNLNLENSLAGYGTIYFYKNSTEFHVNSKGNNSPISRIHKLMEAYKDKYFVIEGYHSGSSVENVPQLDESRAIHMRDSLIVMGIESKRLSIKACADSVLLEPDRKLSRFLVTKDVFLEYNRNMRVEVKWNKEHE